MLFKRLWQQAIVRYIICAGAPSLFTFAADSGWLDKPEYWSEPALIRYYQNPRFYSQKFPLRKYPSRWVNQSQKMPLAEYLKMYVGKPQPPTRGEIWDTYWDRDELTALFVSGLVLPALIIWRKALYRMSKKLIRVNKKLVRGSISSLRFINSKLNKFAE